MAEEHGFQPQEGHRLCANNCGFFGNLTSSDLCSKCQRDSRLKEEQNAFAKSAFDDNNSPAKSASPASPSLTPSPLTSSSIVIPTLKLPGSASSAVDLPSPSPVAQPNRCGACRKRVGLTGFKCRCGSTFCGSHRYAEGHGCTFDYKAMGKEAIARANPVVKAAKLQRI